MARTRLTAIITATAVTLGAVTVPPATAAPSVTVRESAHGQPLCTVTHSAEDHRAAQDLEDAYIATVRRASELGQAALPKHKAAFDAVAKITQADLTAALDLPDVATAAADLKTKGYTDADVTIILVGASHPELLVSDTASVLLESYPESSLTRADKYLKQAQGISGNRAPKLSDGKNFSETFRDTLAAAESEARLPEAIAAFEGAAGKDALVSAWSECIAELEARGATRGSTPLPDIEHTVPAPSQGSSSTGVIIAIVALIIAAGVGYVALNGGEQFSQLIPYAGNLGGNAQPVLRLPLPGI